MLITTVLTAVLCAAGIVLGFLSGFSLSGEQLELLKTLCLIAGCSALFCFTVGELTGNNSQMDKLWSLLPIAYVWVAALFGGMRIRAVILAVLVTVWGIRLTVNFARKGAYSIRFWEGKEDYRWQILRKKPVLKNRLVWALFDLFFISVYQNGIVLAICLPAVAVAFSDAPLGWTDALAVVFSCAALALETVADEQQWRFHSEKKRLLEEGKKLEDLPEPYRKGFNTTGIWAFSRHPNYLGEQSFWIGIYLFVLGIGATAVPGFHWTVCGCLLLVLLFLGSSVLGEKITSGKYPEYARYRKRVFKYLPLRKYK